MVYSLRCKMLYGAASTVAAHQTASSPACSFSIWLLMLTNIRDRTQPAVHRVNGHMMEKYYVVGAALAVTLPPLAAKQYGTQLIWSLFAAVGETMVFLVVLGFMFRHQFVHGRQIPSGSRSRSGSDANTLTRTDAKARVVDHAAQYRGVIIRISFYPLASIVLNGLSVGCDLYLSVIGSITTQTEFNINILTNVIYGMRPSVYALLALSDPALMRAMSSVVAQARGRMEDTSGNGSSGVGVSHTTGASQGQITVHIELEEVRQADDGGVLPPPVVKHNGSSLFNVKAGEGFGTSGDNLPNRLDALRREQLQRAQESKAAAAVAREERKDFKTQI
ncbi:hypothetical protein C8R44DRAFT_744298 [Mycena epipterygia]|nr:hypothetical protein C8R44DRAFT_744298 [Mycena epipterygia]